MKLLPIFSIVLLDIVGFALIIPILPFYAENFGANATVVGLLLASYAAMQFFCAPVWGRLSDRIGRRRVLCMTVAGNALALLVLGVANSLVFIFLARLISGVFAANISVATAYVTDVTDERSRAGGMALIGMAFGFGYVIGPAMGGWLVSYGYSVPFFVAAALQGLNFLQISWKLPEPERHVAISDSIDKKSVLHIPRVRNMAILNFVMIVGITQLEATFAFFMMDQFLMDARSVAYLLVFVAAVMVFVQGGFVRRVKNVPEWKLLLIGSFSLAISLLLMPWQSGMKWLLLVLALGGIGRGICQPIMLSIVSKSSKQKNKGAIMGAYHSAASLARVFAPAIAGLLYDSSFEAPFIFGGLCIASVGVASFLFRDVEDSLPVTVNVSAAE